MKKIIAAFDGINYSASTADYAINLVKNGNAHLVGVFLDDIVYHSYKFSDILSKEGGVSDEKLKELDKKDEDTRKHSMQVFKRKCEDAGISSSIHRDRNVALKDLLRESIYGDLLIIDRKEDFNIFKNEIPSDFMRDVLTDVECPVLVVPEKYTPVQKIIVLYDGDPSSADCEKTSKCLKLGP